MNEKIVFAFLVQCTLCLAIRVPVDWDNDSEVKDHQLINNRQPEAQIYNEYFQYPAKKPQFAIDIAAAHGVKSPQNHFKSYPIRPHTGVAKPVLGQHLIINSDENKNQPFQRLVQSSGGLGFAHPVATSFEVYHPYQVEQPALQGLYKDPVLDKIRYDLRDTNNRFKKYENEAGESNISKDEYLESPQHTDRKKSPQKNNPTQFEIHRPQRRPIYYRVPSRPNNREQLLNHKLRHPWNQNIAKVTPNHYHPVKNHLSNLREQHALKYDDERNEYPQLPPPENYEEKPDGYDIFEKGKVKYEKLRNNVDETLNKVKQEKRPSADYELEQPNHDSSENQDEEEFVPIKNYAQVRKTETTKHLPRTAALSDAESIEEIQNAPRLREAIKSTKAQIVYSEEGYEDAAYDHAGEQKHASDHEHHGGYLKENEISGGKYKLPSVNAGYSDAKGSALREQLLHGKKWEDDKKEHQDEIESNDYSESDGEQEIISDVIADVLNVEDESGRNKRDSESLSVTISPEKNLNKDENDTLNKIKHDVIKRETSVEIPEFDFNSTLPSEDDILKLSEVKVKTQQLKTNAVHSEKIKYPYYSNNFKTLNKNSPLRYAENVKLIPKKSSGGTEFYDSRSEYDCPEVEENVDPLPEKLKKDGHPDDDENPSHTETKGDKFSSLKTKQRLKGLGDKIDCFKAKYFGENPLDSPFFKEDTIENPEPVTKPNLKVFETKHLLGPSDKLLHYNNDIFSVLDKLQINRKKNDEPSLKNSTLANETLLTSESKTNIVLHGIINKDREKNMKIIENILNSNATTDPSNVIYKHFQNIKDITRSLPVLRKRRATPFMYEPYKIIRDSQVQDSKKTTTTSNISPLIKQLQSSRVIDKVNANTDKEQAIKKNTKVYKDIGKIDRQNSTPNEAINDSSTVSFVDVSSDKRRGEPRYELRSIKATNTPIENKQLLSIEGNKTQNNNNKTETNTKSATRTQIKRSKLPKTTLRPYFDVSKYLPQTLETQHIAASNTVRKIIRTTTPETQATSHQSFKHNNDEDEEYDEYEDDEEQTDTTTTTTTTTKRPSIRKRTRGTTTTSTTTTTTTLKPIVIENDRERPKLRLTTRIRNPPSVEKSDKHFEVIKEPLDKIYSREENPPKYTEKKRKSTKSTLVTDTKTYGDDDDDTTRKEVDALLRVKQDMNEYMPNYEKEHNKYSSFKDDKRKNNFGSEDEEDDDNDDEDDDDDDDDDGDDDDVDTDDNDEDEEDGDSTKNHENHNEEDNDEDEEDEEDDDEKEKSKIVEEHEDGPNYRTNKKIRLHVTTSEPTKRTLARTTIAPPTTTESRSARIELKPTVLKKKIEIHEETPINRSSPHVTQFKQDIKEIEIIKEMPPKPRRKSNKNLEALDLYRDENLAEEINKLGDVEVFRENLDLKSGPKHGGNYRSITPEELQREKDELKLGTVKNKDDVETSQTETRKLIELSDVSMIHPKSFTSSSSSLSPNNEARNAKFIELRDSVETIPKSMHGGNLKFSRNKGSRQNKKSEKLIEFDEDDEDPQDTSRMHGGNFRSYGNRNSGRPMHGGNYKSAKIIQAEDATDKPPRSRGKTRDSRTNAAITSLNGFARAAPILTTTPAFILDPSKRMYYYVDA